MRPGLRAVLTAAAAGSLAFGCTQQDDLEREATDRSGFEFYADFEHFVPDLTASHVRLTHWDNTLEVVDEMRDGQKTRALRARAVGAAAPISTAALHIDGLDARAGDIVEIAMCVKGPAAGDISDIVIANLGCADCGSPLNPDQDVAPGLALQFAGGRGFLEVDRTRLLSNDAFASLRAPGNAWPRRWAPLVWRIGLETGEEGWVEVFADGVLMVAARGGVLPDRERFEQIGVRLDREHYDHVHIGVAGHVGGGFANVLVDNIQIRSGARLGGGLPNPCADLTSRLFTSVRQP